MWLMLALVLAGGGYYYYENYSKPDVENNADNESINLIRTFEKGLDHYFRKDWDSAIKYFEKANSLEDHFDSRNTTPSSVYIDRCTMFKENPPDDDWDGVWAMTSK